MAIEDATASVIISLNFQLEGTASRVHVSREEKRSHL
jgi:hypothetical protein